MRSRNGNEEEQWSLGDVEHCKVEQRLKEESIDAKKRAVKQLDHFRNEMNLDVVHTFGFLITREGSKKMRRPSIHSCYSLK